MFKHSCHSSPGGSNPAWGINLVANTKYVFHNWTASKAPLLCWKYTTNTHAIQLHKLFNLYEPPLDWLALNFFQRTSSRPTCFSISVSSNYKIGNNILSNLLSILNKKIDLTWLYQLLRSNVRNYSFFLVSALLRNYSLCWDRVNGTWLLHVTRPCLLALGRVLIWVCCQIVEFWCFSKLRGGGLMLMRDTPKTPQSQGRLKPEASDIYIYVRHLWYNISIKP